MADPRSPTALVTGASSGIGSELALEFAGDGYDLVLTARREDRLESLASELESAHDVSALVLPADLSDPDAPRRLFEDLQSANVQVDALVNNAGFSIAGRFAETDLSTELDMLQVNLVAPTELTKRFGREMVARGHGEILTTASIAGMAPTPTISVYAATKAYLLSFTEAIAYEFADDGVTVTALCPGPVDTELVTSEGMAGSGVEDQRMNDPASVARAGYQGLKDGDTVVVPSTRMKALSQVKRVLPRDRLVSLAASFYE